MAAMSLSPLRTREIRRGAEALVCCAICTDSFRNPKVLPCQHTFCLSCLTKFYDSCNQQRVVKLSNFPCPECRKVTYLPSGGLENLPNDFKVNQIQDFIQTLHFGDDIQDVTVCDVCKYDDVSELAVSYCVQCSKNLCQKCEEQHAGTALFKDHNILSKDTNAIMNSALSCPQHQEEIRYYCLSCTAPLCTVCTLSKHGQHDVTGIDSILSRQREDMKRHLAEAQGKLTRHELLLDEIAKVKQDQERDLERVRNAVRNHVIAVVGCIKEQEADLLDKLQEGYRGYQDQLGTLERRTEEGIRRLGGVCGRVSRALEPGRSLELLAGGLVDGGLGEELRDAAGDEVPVLPRHLRLGTTFMPNSGFEIGTVTWDTEEEEPDSFYLATSSLTKEINDSTDIYTSQSSVSISNNNPSNGDHAETDQYDPGPLSPSDPFTRYTTTHKWKAQYFYESRDVTFLSDGCMAATDLKVGGDRVKIYSSKGDLQHWVQGNTRSILRPWGITTTTTAEHIIITDHGDQAVKILDRQLAVAHVWRNRFTRPAGVAVTRAGKVVISDPGSTRFKLSIFTPTGVRTREFAAHGDELSNLLTPNYVTIDQHDRILVSDCENHCIKGYDHQGNSLLQFGSEGRKAMCPQGIWVDEGNNILVVDQNTNSVSMFSSSGTYIQTVAELDTREQLWGVAGYHDKYLALTRDQALEVFDVNKS